MVSKSEAGRRAMTVTFTDCYAIGEQARSVRVYIPDLDKRVWIPKNQIPVTSWCRSGLPGNGGSYDRGTAGRRPAFGGL